MLSTDQPIAVIPARGGSKRVPKKNTVAFNGKPLIAWTIEAALASQCFSAVYVSTDCEEIAACARRYGAEVPFLRDQYADDISNVSQATAWFVQQLQSRGMLSATSVVQLMANCPIRSEETLRKFMTFCLSSPLPQGQGAEALTSVISVVEPRYGSPYWAIQKTPQAQGAFVFPDYASQRSQDLPPCFYPTGSLWFAPTATLIKECSFYAPGYRVFDIPWLEAIDIDTPEELDVAACLHQAFISGRLVS